MSQHIKFVGFSIKYIIVISIGKINPKSLIGETANEHKDVRRLQLHLILITLAGAITMILLLCHIGNAVENGFIPITPSAMQEILDYIKKL